MIKLNLKKADCPLCGKTFTSDYALNILFCCRECRTVFEWCNHSFIAVKIERGECRDSAALLPFWRLRGSVRYKQSSFFGDNHIEHELLLTVPAFTTDISDIIRIGRRVSFFSEELTVCETGAFIQPVIDSACSRFMGKYIYMNYAADVMGYKFLRRIEKKLLFSSYSLVMLPFRRE